MNKENYKIEIFWSDKDKTFIAVCPAFEGLAVVAQTRAKALKEAELALQSYIEIYIEDGMPLPKPDEVLEYSGQVRLRLPKWLHQKSAHRAEAEGVSLNTFFVDAISMRVGAEDMAERLLASASTAKVIQPVMNIFVNRAGFTPARQELSFPALQLTEKR